MKTWGKVFMNIVFIVVTIYLATCLFLYMNQNTFIFFPNRETPDTAEWGVPDMHVIVVESEPGLKLSGWYKPPADPQKPVVILFHGNAVHHGARAFMARHLMDLGYGYLLAGYRGYGGNGGRPGEQGFYKDARAYLKWLQETQDIPPDRIVLAGESLGTGVALQMATEYDAAALILQAPYTSLVDIARERFFMFPVGLMMKNRFENAAKIKDVHMPLLIVHGERDDIVPFRFGKALFDAANEPQTFTALPAAGHNDLYAHGAGEQIAAFLGFLPAPVK